VASAFVVAGSTQASASVYKEDWYYVGSPFGTIYCGKYYVRLANVADGGPFGIYDRTHMTYLNQMRRDVFCEGYEWANAGYLQGWFKVYMREYSRTTNQYVPGTSFQNCTPYGGQWNVTNPPPTNPSAFINEAYEFPAMVYLSGNGSCDPTSFNRRKAYMQFTAKGAMNMAWQPQPYPNVTYVTTLDTFEMLGAEPPL
jgi:hypothetical protein